MADQTIAELLLKITADASKLKEELDDVNLRIKKSSDSAKRDSASFSSILTSGLGKLGGMMNGIQNGMEQIGRSMRVASREIGQLGGAMAAVTFGAMAAASKENKQVALTLYEMQEALKSFSNQIAIAAVPYVKVLTGLIQKLALWFQNLDPSVKSAIGGFLVFGAALLTVTAITLKLGGAFVGLFSKLFTPLGLGLSALAIFAAAWVNNWLGIRDLTTMIILSIKQELDNLYGKVLFIARFMGYKAGGMSWKEAWENASKDLEEFKSKSNSDSVGIASSMDKLANSLQNSAAKIKEAMKGIGGDQGGGLGGELFAGFKLGLLEMQKKFGNFGQAMQEMATNFANAMSSAFSTFFFDVFTNQVKSAKEYFADFGKAILKMIADLIAQMIAFYILGQILGVFGFKMSGGMGISKLHEGGVAGFGNFFKKAHEGLAPGEVPVIAQSGEGFLSRNGMATIGGAQGLANLNAGEGIGGPKITLIQHVSSWDASDFMRNRKFIGAAMIEELQKNGGLRSIMRKYS